MSKIGPMENKQITKIISIGQNKYSMPYFHVYFKDNFCLTATRLHAFCVVRDGKELFIPTHELKKKDNIWIDTSAFLSDGSLKKS